MFDARETTQLIAQAEQVHRELHNKVLEQELAVLKSELKQLPKCHGVMKDVQEMSCEYYTHELKNTLTVLQAK